MPDDPRHGTEAGHEQHARDCEDACQPCYEAKILAARRRTKRKTMGHRYTLPLGARIHATIVDLLDRGATLEGIAEWSGVTESQVFRCHANGPDAIVYARTWRRLHEMRPGHIVTPLGITRRIQALMWLGYSSNVIATEAGVHNDTIRDARDNPRVFLAARVKASIVDAYERLHMSLPEGGTKQEKAGVTRSRNTARRNGWLPPLAWDDIDDLSESPRDWHYLSTDRADALRDLAEMGVGITEACRRLHVSRDALERWCERKGLNDAYLQMAGREALWENQHTREAS